MQVEQQGASRTCERGTLTPSSTPPRGHPPPSPATLGLIITRVISAAEQPGEDLRTVSSLKVLVRSKTQSSLLQSL